MPVDPAPAPPRTSLTARRLVLAAFALVTLAGVRGGRVHRPPVVRYARYAARCEALPTFDRRFIGLAGDAPVRVTEP